MLKISFAIAAECGSLPRGLTRLARKLFLPPPVLVILSRDLPQDFPPLRSILAEPRYIFPLGFAKKSGRWTRKMDREERETRARRIDMRAKRKVTGNEDKWDRFIPRKWYTSVTPVRPYVASIKILRATLSSTLRSLLLSNLILPVNFCFVLDDV